MAGMSRRSAPGSNLSTISGLPDADPVRCPETGVQAARAAPAPQRLSAQAVQKLNRMYATSQRCVTFETPLKRPAVTRLNRKAYHSSVGCSAVTNVVAKVTLSRSSMNGSAKALSAEARDPSMLPGQSGADCDASCEQDTLQPTVCSTLTFSGEKTFLDIAWLPCQSRAL